MQTAARTRTAVHHSIQLLVASRVDQFKPLLRVEPRSARGAIRVIAVQIRFDPLFPADLEPGRQLAPRSDLRREKTDQTDLNNFADRSVFRTVTSFRVVLERMMQTAARTRTSFSIRYSDASRVGARSARGAIREIAVQIRFDPASP